ncbi:MULTISPECIES: AAA family ATPase [Halocynthiibacter]|uniref:AAA family ATPase n=1 Tax=Halocynthiibacter halioticoli TaxID=2986804 RepID=A0AAE3LRB6_9RHOB|nr:MULTISPECIES: AAA family ATPase [Halocynthiibacter]MCV6825402.1 AAA family ATPase [Halocynthiibacter halioticoli]MCW4058403.1 AAA family ATPase [Halocynthiibacter sp. SDUM655004]
MTVLSSPSAASATAASKSTQASPARASAAAVSPSHATTTSSASPNALMRRRPEWWSFAQEVITRLRKAQMEKLKLQAAERAEAQAALQAHAQRKPSTPRPSFGATYQPPLHQSPFLQALLEHAGPTQNLPEVTEAIRAEGGDPYATDTEGRAMPAPALPHRELLMALRLAVSFGSSACITRALAPGSLTLILGHEGGRLVEKLMSNILLPDGWDSCGPIPTAFEPRRLYIPDTMSPKDLKHILATRTPILCFAETEEELPPLLQDTAPQQARLSLAPVTQDLLLAVLRASHSATGRVDEAAVCKALPDEVVLAEMNEVELLFALRAPTALEAAESLAMLAERKRATPGPTPDPTALMGTTTAHQAARRIMSDLKLWTARQQESSKQAPIPWGELTRSLLIHGAPGTGKSYMARQMARYAGATLVEASFATWQSAGHLGQMLNAMRASFDEALKASPAVLFIDEIDAVGSRFGSDHNGKSYRVQVINGFLEQVDRLARHEGVILVGACNRVESLDPAIQRPGRFDEIIEMPLPDLHDITAMLRGALGQSCDKATVTSPAITSLAHSCVGRTPAVIDAALRAAKSEARLNSCALDLPTLEKHLGATQEDPARLRRIALHEAGHALVSALLTGQLPQRIVIAADSGFVEEARATPPSTRQEFEDRVAILLAGRAAEHLMLGEVSSGSGGGTKSDLARATLLLTQMSRELGLGLHGPLWLGPIVPQSLSDKEHNDITAKLTRQQDRARDLLAPRKGQIERLADVLVAEREVKRERLVGLFKDMEV